jgi:Xaa-Pro aminopeptidase
MNNILFEENRSQSLIQEKVKQAIGVLREQEVDMWLTFVRETNGGGDPILPLIYGLDLTWQSALILTSSGERIAIVGRLEAEAARRTDAYDTVLQYDHSIKPELISTLNRLQPKKIAVNYSLDDVHADGLTFGMYQLLNQYLEDTPFASRLISAEKLHSALRGRKTPQEIERIRLSIRTTYRIFERTFDFIKPGMSEIEVSDFMHRQLEISDVKPAWEAFNCPTVNAGPESAIGHVGPTDLSISPGQIVHFDFGVLEDGYCSDIQRVIYFLRPGEKTPPDKVVHGFITIRNAIEQARKSMKPGVTGKYIDQIARQAVIEAGYPEYPYATGHQLGRLVHDGAGLLGPEWERYGDTPNYLLEAGQVYTLEPGLIVEGFGYIGLEEDVVVTTDGADYLGDPQADIITKST